MIDKKKTLPVLLAVLIASSAATPPDGQEIAGQALAERLRNSQPAEESQIHGVIHIIPGKDRPEIAVPIVCDVKLHDSTWETDYLTGDSKTPDAQRLVIIHTANGPNQYQISRAAAAPLPLTETTLPLAGSDFSAADLGLEFLHWPMQRQLPGVMRLGRPCDVLESKNPASQDIVRIKSYIDKESGGLLIAEAYDAKDKLVKKFSLHGSSFKKVNGRWRLEKMEILNEKTGSQTVIKFDIHD